MHKAMALKAIRSTLEHGQSVRSFMATVCKSEEIIRQAAHALAEIAEALQEAGFEFHVVDPEWQQLAELRGYARTAWIETLATEQQLGIVGALSQVVDHYAEHISIDDPVEPAAEPLEVALVSSPKRFEQHQVVRDARTGEIMGSEVITADAP